MSVRMALLIAAIFEFLGASLMGGHVAGTLRDDIFNIQLVGRPRCCQSSVDGEDDDELLTTLWHHRQISLLCVCVRVRRSQYANEPQILITGMTAAMVGAFIMVFLATAFSLPVSGTHSVGASPSLSPSIQLNRATI